MVNYLNQIDITPEQYHAGLDKLWTALKLTDVQEMDVFTLAAQQIESQRVEIEQLRKYIRTDYNRYESYHPYAHKLREQFPWLII